LCQLRGGSFYSYDAYLRCGVGRNDYRNDASGCIGLRCCAL
jgi:formylglycine-generating enzyme required for sulfatase activity